MLKKRILASSLASVMALSTVSVVAFADETADIKTEVVTKAQLKGYVDSLKTFVDKDLKNYGSNQADKLKNAIKHAEKVIADRNSDTDDATAAYQMVKNVKDNIRIYTATELKELIEECKGDFETGNVKNSNLGDKIYKEDTFDVFSGAYAEAVRYVKSTDSGRVSNVYCALQDAVDGLKLNETITKSEFLTVYKQFVELTKKDADYEPWRRGKCVVAPATGNAKYNDAQGIEQSINLTAVDYLTYGDLMNVLFTDTTDNTLLLDKQAVTLVDGKWIGKDSATGLALDIEEQYNRLNAEKTTNVTSDGAIINAYKSAKDVIAVFNGWEADDTTYGVDTNINQLLKKYHDKLVKDFYSASSDIITSLQSQLGAYGALITEKTDGEKTNGDPAKQVKIVDAFPSATGTEDWKKDANGYIMYTANKNASPVVWEYVELELDKKTGMIPAKIDRSGDWKYDTTVTSVTKKKIKLGMDLTSIIPVSYVDMGSATDFDLANALNLFEIYKAEKALKTGRNFKAAFTAVVDNDGDGDASTHSLSVKALDTHGTIKEGKGNPSEWTLIYRYLTYLLADRFDTPDTRYTLDDVKALAEKASDLLEVTGEAGAYATAHEALFDQYELALAFIADSDADANYKDNSVTVATYVTLEKAYNDLNGVVADYPVSYDEVRDLIITAANGADSGVFSNAATVKSLANTLAFKLSILDATDDASGEASNEAFDGSRVFTGYNRVYAKGTNAEKELLALYNELKTAVEEGTKASEVKSGDADGDGTVTAKDALLALKFSAGSVTLTDAQKAAADVDGDGVVTAKDALAILKASAQG